MGSKNEIKPVLFEPQYVGWKVGLTKAIEEAKHFGVPLAVKNDMIAAEVRLRNQYPPEIKVLNK